MGTAVTGEDWERFGRIGSLAFDGAGNLHIFDEQAQLVHVVGTDGGLIRQLGGPGEGPGEFSTSGAGVARILKRPFPSEPVTGRIIRAERDRRLRRLEETARPGENLENRRQRIEELEFHTELPSFVVWGRPGTGGSGCFAVARIPPMTDLSMFSPQTEDTWAATGRVRPGYRTRFGPDGNAPL